MQIDCEQVGAHLTGYADLFSCAPVERSPVPGLLEIETPFLYPDGDVIAVFLAPDGVVSDVGEAHGWMWLQNAGDPTLTPEQARLLAEVCQTYGLASANGSLFIRLERVEDLVGTVLRLSQGILAITWSANWTSPPAGEVGLPAQAAR